MTLFALLNGDMIHDVFDELYQVWMAPAARLCCEPTGLASQIRRVLALAPSFGPHWGSVACRACPIAASASSDTLLLHLSSVTSVRGVYPCSLHHCPCLACLLQSHPFISRVYLYTFISLFIYAVLNIFVAIVEDAFFASKAVLCALLFVRPSSSFRFLLGAASPWLVTDFLSPCWCSWFLTQFQLFSTQHPLDQVRSLPSARTYTLSRRSRSPARCCRASLSHCSLYSMLFRRIWTTWIRSSSWTFRRSTATIR